MWSPYLAFPTCPRCGSDLAAARLFLEKNRLRRIAIVSVVVGTLVAVLAELLQMIFD